MVLDYAISAQKYPKIGGQEKEKFKESPTVFFKTTAFLRSVDIVFQMFKCINQTFQQNKKISWDKTGKKNYGVRL